MYKNVCATIRGAMQGRALLRFACERMRWKFLGKGDREHFSLAKLAGLKLLQEGIKYLLRWLSG